MEVLLCSSSVFKWVPTNIACSGNNSGNRCSHHGHKPPCFCVIRMEGCWHNNVSAEIGEWDWERWDGNVGTTGTSVIFAVDFSEERTCLLILAKVIQWNCLGKAKWKSTVPVLFHEKIKHRMDLGCVLS